MTKYITLTRMAPASIADYARSLCAALAGDAAGGDELTTGLVPIGSTSDIAPTWFITGGPIDIEFAKAMKDPEVMFNRCQLANLPITLEQCQGILSACVIDDREPLEVISEMKLQLWSPPDSSL